MLQREQISIVSSSVIELRARLLRAASMGHCNRMKEGGTQGMDGLMYVHKTEDGHVEEEVAHGTGSHCF